jgi:hypothetical protein
LKYNPLDISFFSHDDRKGETKSIAEPFEEAFQQIYSKRHSERNQQKMILPYENAQSHPFYQKLLEFQQSLPKLDGENSKCDEVFSDYVFKMSRYCNPTYFVKLIKFITLFRECVNVFYKDKVKTEGYEFSQIFNAEDVPDISNEFITEFLDTDQNVFDISKDEAIDLTQNFCHWLYENNFTCSKLSLISNY